MPSGRAALKPRGPAPFLSGRPGVYTHSVAHVKGEPESGDELELINHASRFIARGRFNPACADCTRLYRWKRRRV